MNKDWISVEDKLPKDGQRVLAYIKGNKVFLPGLMESEMREVIVLHFEKDFYPAGSERRDKHGAHFWKGEGNSNHFFNDVSHWRPIPEGPKEQ